MDEQLNVVSRHYYGLKLRNGGIPLVWQGGLLDGLEYFPIQFDDVDYLLTKDGLFTFPIGGGPLRPCIPKHFE